jgi:predicted nucleic acid-binding protein
MNEFVCVDASFVVKLMVNEENSDKARALWAHWMAVGVTPVAPCHLTFESISIFRQLVHRSVISHEAGQIAFEAFLAQPIRLLHPESACERAWKLAAHFRRPTVYDAYYLAVGELYGCDVWTADRRLHRAVQLDLPWVKLLDYYQPDPPAKPSQDVA